MASLAPPAIQCAQRFHRSTVARTTDGAYFDEGRFAYERKGCSHCTYNHNKGEQPLEASMRSSSPARRHPLLDYHYFNDVQNVVHGVRAHYISV